MGRTTDSESTPPLIEYQNVTVMRNDRIALDKMSLSISVGEHVAILGPNGAGKSSLIKTITRELWPVENGSDYSLRILGKELWDVAELRSHLGIVGAEPLKSQLLDFTCREMVLSGFFGSVGIWPNHHVTPAMERKTDEVMEFVGITHLSDVDSSQISTGESRRIMIARALVHNPRTMLLDEPTSSLDPGATAELRQTMRKIAGHGKSLVMITHNLSDIVPEIERVILIRQGKVVGDGNKRQMLTSAKLSQLFGVSLEVFRRDGYYYCW
jgi:iron complex transport system ATP-binding protein